MATKRQIIARNIADMLHDGDVVNLGVGIPSLVGNYISEGITIFLHSENGCVGMGQELETPWDFSDRDSVISWMNGHRGEAADWRTGHKDLYNASDALITLNPGACCFDTVLSFAIARGGHLDVTVLGGLQVDMDANLARQEVKWYGRCNGFSQRCEESDCSNGALLQNRGTEADEALHNASDSGQLCGHGSDGLMHDTMQWRGNDCNCFGTRDNEKRTAGQNRGRADICE